MDSLDRIEVPNRPDLRPFVGRYRSDTTGTEAVVAENTSGPQIRMIGRFGSVDYSLRGLSECIWRTNARLDIPPGFLLSFDKDNTGFQVRGYRTLSLRFRRIY